MEEGGGMENPCLENIRVRNHVREQFHIWNIVHHVIVQKTMQKGTLFSEEYMQIFLDKDKCSIYKPVAEYV